MTHEVYCKEKLKFTGSADQCWVYVLFHQPMSVSWAERYGDWSIRKKMSLPKIEHDLSNTPLSLKEKLEYIKARCVISACLNAESGSVIFEKEKEAIDTLNRLNVKCEGINNGL